jgi:hypothetical protein
VANTIDPTADIDELWAIKRSNEMELDLIDLWLGELDGEPGRPNDLQHLVELRNLCILRNILVMRVESEQFVATG